MCDMEKNFQSFSISPKQCIDYRLLLYQTLSIGKTQSFRGRIDKGSYSSKFLLFYIILDQVVLEGEAQLSSIRKERRKLFNDLLGVKGNLLFFICFWSEANFFPFCNPTFFFLSGNIRVCCRVRPQFEHEGPCAIEFPSDFLIRVNSASNSAASSKKEFEFDRVYGPHVNQGNTSHW